jgi:hypothetical protein
MSHDLTNLLNASGDDCGGLNGDEAADLAKCVVRGPCHHLFIIKENDFVDQLVRVKERYPLNDEAPTLGEMSCDGHGWLAHHRRHMTYFRHMTYRRHVTKNTRDNTKKQRTRQGLETPEMRYIHHLDLLRLCGFPQSSSQSPTSNTSIHHPSTVMAPLMSKVFPNT